MFRIINKLKNRKGFTLIELIVVLAVLAIIMAIAIPKFVGIQAQAKLDADASAKAMVEKAAQLYYVTEEDTSFTVDDLIDNGYVEAFTLNDEDYNTATEVEAVTVTVDESTGAVTLSW